MPDAISAIATAIRLVMSTSLGTSVASSPRTDRNARPASFAKWRARKLLGVTGHKKLTVHDGGIEPPELTMQFLGHQLLIKARHEISHGGYRLLPLALDTSN